MCDNDQVHLNEPAETDGHWTKLGSIYPFKRGPPLQLQPLIPIWEPGPTVTVSSDFSSESEFLYTISQFLKVDNMFFLIIIMWGRPNKIHLRVKWSCSWATGLQPLYFRFIGNIILNVISPPSLGSMREYAKYFFIFSESPEPNIIQRPTLWSKGWITLICTATGQEMLNFLNISKWLSSVYVHIYACRCCAMLSHVWLCNPMDCSLPGSSVHEISQARVLEWVAVSFYSIYAYMPENHHILKLTLNMRIISEVL